MENAREISQRIEDRKAAIRKDALEKGINDQNTINEMMAADPYI